MTDTPIRVQANLVTAVLRRAVVWSQQQPPPDDVVIMQQVATTELSPEPDQVAEPARRLSRTGQVMIECLLNLIC